MLRAHSHGCDKLLGFFSDPPQLESVREKPEQAVFPRFCLRIRRLLLLSAPTRVCSHYEPQIYCFRRHLFHLWFLSHRHRLGSHLLQLSPTDLFPNKRVILIPDGSVSLLRVIFQFIFLPVTNLYGLMYVSFRVVLVILDGFDYLVFETNTIL